MPGDAGSPYWAAVDFDSEEDAQTPTNNQRVYLDPWDNEAYGTVPTQTETPDSSQGENGNSLAGEPVSASFYYVPTKNYDSGEEPPLPPPKWKRTVPEELIAPEYSKYGRKVSRAIVPDLALENPLYGEYPIQDRRRSMFIEEPTYVHHAMLYEPLYGTVPPGYIPPPPRTRMSLSHPPEHVMATVGYVDPRRHSRMTHAYEQFTYESLSPDYEDWARPLPKTAPDNFHLSRYGHLQIDYSFSWNSLDRLIRSQHRAQ